MDNSIRTINVQVQSFGNYLRDVWIVALIFVLIQNQTTIDLPIIWIGLQLVIAIASLFIFRKTGPNMVVPFIVPSVILLLLFLFGSSIWLFVIGVGISIWRIQARFNRQQHEQNIDSNFTLLFFVTFLLVHFFNIIMRNEGYHLLLYAVFITGVVLFVGLRLFSVLKNTDKYHSLGKNKLLGIYLVSIGAVASVSVFIYFIAPIFRRMIEVLFVAILGVVIIPIRPLLAYLEKLLSGLQLKEMEESTREPVGQQDEIEPNEIIKDGIFANFPFEWILFGLVAIVLWFFVRYLLKNKPEKLKVEQNNIQYENEQMSVEEEKQNQFISFYKVETSLLREKYAQFEVEGQLFKLGRNRSETVREWFKRMDWKVNNEFFSIYEEVRYGGHTIESQKAELFIKTLIATKNKYFVEKEV